MCCGEAQSHTHLITQCNYYCYQQLQNGGGERLQLDPPRPDHGEGGGVHEAAPGREGAPAGREPGGALQRQPAEAAAPKTGFVQQILQQPRARTPGGS